MQRRPLVMGVVNVTPDSFSDGGLFYRLEDAFRHVDSLVEAGADILDIGGESTRPGAATVSIVDELARVLPVIEYARKTHSVPVSIDTRKPEVARRAGDCGASILNDVNGGRDIRMAQMAQEFGWAVILMHMQGTPSTMQAAPKYERGVVTEVRDFLAERVAAFVEAGIPKSRLWIDPGIGFGKTVEHNLELLGKIREFVPLADRVVIGVSRKSFISKVNALEGEPIESREPGGLAANLWAYHQGASVFRVHRAGEMRRALQVWEAIRARS